MKTRRKSPVRIEEAHPHLCTIDLRMKLIGQLPFFMGLSPQALSVIHPKFIETGYQPEEYLYFAGDPADRLYVVAQGMVKVFQTASNGRNILLDIHSPGEFFGNLMTIGTTVYPDTAQAQTPTCVLSISSEEFRKILVQHPETAVRVLDVMSKRLQDANERVYLLSSAPVEKRIAATLLKLGEKLGKRREVGWLIDAPISRDSLAEMTGSTTETASRVMSAFQSEGLIRSGRQWVAILDKKRLRDITENQ